MIFLLGKYRVNKSDSEIALQLRKSNNKGGCLDLLPKHKEDKEGNKSREVKKRKGGNGGTGVRASGLEIWESGKAINSKDRFNNTKKI